MPFSRCQDVIERVSVVIDGEASSWDRMRFHMHLAMCPPCKRYYRQIVQTRALGTEPQPDDLPEDFEQVMAFVLDVVQSADAAGAADSAD